MPVSSVLGLESVLTYVGGPSGFLRIWQRAVTDKEIRHGSNEDTGAPHDEWRVILY
ncbi:MAG: hypothetical protein ACI9SE_002676 [Neolewinella sp.]|jgi:hypothetical protein